MIATAPPNIFGSLHNAADDADASVLKNFFTVVVDELVDVDVLVDVVVVVEVEVLEVVVEVDGLMFGVQTVILPVRLRVSTFSSSGK